MYPGNTCGNGANARQCGQALALPSWWTKPSEVDLQVIAKQLGRTPRGVTAVARRCRFGSPQVIVTSPVVYGPGRRSEHQAGVAVGEARVFPTVYWLTCSYLQAAIGRLEGAGWVGRIGEWLHDSRRAKAMTAVHARAAAERVALASAADWAHLKEEYPGQWQVLVSSGVGGARKVEGIKCLHTHLADYLAGPVGAEAVDQEAAEAMPGERNPVGAQVLVLLLKNGIDVKGWLGCGQKKGQCQRTTTQECHACRRSLPVAALDVGTNSCRLLVMDADQDGAWHRRLAAIESTRLGAGAASGGCLSVEGIERTLVGIEGLLAQADATTACCQGGPQVVAVATSAVRNAANAGDLLIPAWERFGIAVRVVSGEEEARLSFRGALAGVRGQAGSGSLGVLDVGGGSTELLLGQLDGSVQWAKSVHMGAVRLAEAAAGAGANRDTQSDATELRALIDQAKQCLRQEWPSVSPGMLVGVGGTCTSLAAIDLQLPSYDPDRVQGHALTLERVREIATQLAGMRVEERRMVAGLQPARADIIVAGSAILLAALELLQQRRVVISDSDLLLGIVEQFRIACA